MLVQLLRITYFLPYLVDIIIYCVLLFYFYYFILTSSGRQAKVINNYCINLGKHDTAPAGLLLAHVSVTHLFLPFPVCPPICLIAASEEFVPCFPLKRTWLLPTKKQNKTQNNNPLFLSVLKHKLTHIHIFNI